MTDIVKHGSGSQGLVFMKEVDPNKVENLVDKLMDISSALNLPVNERGLIVLSASIVKLESEGGYKLNWKAVEGGFLKFIEDSNSISTLSGDTVIYDGNGISKGKLLLLERLYDAEAFHKRREEWYHSRR